MIGCCLTPAWLFVIGCPWRLDFVTLRHLQAQVWFADVGQVARQWGHISLMPPCLIKLTPACWDRRQDFFSFKH